VLKKAVVGVLVALTLVVGSGFADVGPGIVRAQQHTEITLKPVEQVRDYYIEYATQHGWEKLNDTMREKAMAEVISEGPFVMTASRLYTPRVLWVERMANADYYFRDFDQAEKEFYDDYYVDPADGTSIMTVLREQQSQRLAGRQHRVYCQRFHREGLSGLGGVYRSLSANRKDSFGHHSL